MTEEVIEPEVADTSDNSNVSENQPDVETSSQAAWGELSADDQKYVGDKGFKSPLDALKSYRELEKSAGAKVSLPKADDKEALDKILRQLGAPEDAKEYELKDIRDIDQPFMDGFREAAKDLRILPSQADGIYKWYREAQEAMAEKFNEQSAKDQEEIKVEWGDDFAKNQELMKRGWRMLELPEAMSENIEVSIGTKAFMQLGKKLGDLISEDNARGIANKPGKSEEMTGKAFFEEVLAEGQKNNSEF